MTGLTLGSRISRLLAVGASVEARGAAQVAHYSRGRGGESGAGLRPAS